MSLYIPDLNLPPKGEAYEVYADGSINLRRRTANGYDYDLWGRDARAIEVPPHGRLVDADAFIDYCPELMAYEMLMPTIIPRDGDAK